MRFNLVEDVFSSSKLGFGEIRDSLCVESSQEKGLIWPCCPVFSVFK